MASAQPDGSIRGQRQPSPRVLLATKLGVCARDLTALPIASVETMLDSVRRLEGEVLDELTGLPLRRTGERVVEREFTRASRIPGSHLVLAIIDVDNLKGTNDTGGHDAGDRLIRSVADALTRELRPYDFAMRWGGDEFLAVLPGTDLASARQVMARVSERVRESSGGSISAGLAHQGPLDTVTTLRLRADRAMYRVKKSHHVERGVT